MTENKAPQPGQTQLHWNVDLAGLRASGGIFISIPMYGGMCFGSLTNSLMNLASLCTAHQIPLRMKFLHNESLVQRARNYCADAFLRSDANQMIFIDSDIEFNAQDVIILADLQLKNADYNVLCGPYPKKVIAWEKIKSAVDKGFADEDPNILENFVGDYVFNAVASGTIKLSEPAEVAEAGTGFMMIHRNTFDKFRAAYPEKSYKPDHIRTKDFDGSREIHAYFDCVIDPVSKRYLSEDYYFCQKVREAGMKVWLAPWVQLKHNGYYTFGGSLSHLAMVGENVTADPAQLKNKQ